MRTCSDACRWIERVAAIARYPLCPLRGQSGEPTVALAPQITRQDVYIGSSTLLGWTVLTEWSLTNFKSFRDRQSFALTPLTVLCGANSSGKSSLLQSILAVRQTFEFAPPERVVALNGPLVRLGTFADLLNSRVASRSADSTKEVSIGWSMRMRPQQESRSASGSWPGEENLEAVRVDFTFDVQDSTVDRETQELQPSFKRTQLSAVRPGGRLPNPHRAGASRGRARSTSSPAGRP